MRASAIALSDSRNTSETFNLLRNKLPVCKDNFYVRIDRYSIKEYSGTSEKELFYPSEYCVETEINEIEEKVKGGDSLNSWQRWVHKQYTKLVKEGDGTMSQYHPSVGNGKRLTLKIKEDESEKNKTENKGRIKIKVKGNKRIKIKTKESASKKIKLKISGTVNRRTIHSK